MNFLYKHFAPALKNWRTTLAGLPVLLGGVATIFSNLQEVANGGSPSLESWQAAGATILVGIGLIKAKDSQETGVAK